MNAWEILIDTLASAATEPTVEDVAGYLTDRHVAAWLDRELGMLTPEQILTDICDEIGCGFDGKSDDGSRVNRILLNALVDRSPQTVVWRVLRDAMRRCAVRDACREVDAARTVGGAQEALRAWVESRDPDRVALAAEHNAAVAL